MTISALLAIVKYREFWEARLLLVVFKGSRGKQCSKQTAPFWLANLGLKNESGENSSILEMLI